LRKTKRTIALCDWVQLYLGLALLNLGVCHEAEQKGDTNFKSANYTKDEGGPLGVAVQEEASNYLKLLLSVITKIDVLNCTLNDGY
jgi:hypothetical protein